MIALEAAHNLRFGCLSTYVPRRCGLATFASDLVGAIAEEKLPVAEMFARFMAKRYARCKFIWESSIQIGTWEMTNDPNADVEALSHKVLETVSAPL